MSSNEPLEFHNGAMKFEIGDGLKNRNDTYSQNCSDLKKSGRATQWAKEEDHQLLRLVEAYGQQKWSMVASLLPGRKGKQCRERWHNHLRTDIKKGGWSIEEEVLIVKAHRDLGNQWAEIARRLRGRSENAVKNHFNATLRRKERAAGGRKRNEGSRSEVLRMYLKNLGLTSLSPVSSELPSASTSVSTTSDQESVDMLTEVASPSLSPSLTLLHFPFTTKQAPESDWMQRSDINTKKHLPSAFSSQPCASATTHEMSITSPTTTLAIPMATLKSAHLTHAPKPVTLLEMGKNEIRRLAPVHGLSGKWMDESSISSFSRLVLAGKKFQVQPAASAFTVVDHSTKQPISNFWSNIGGGSTAVGWSM